MTLHDPANTDQESAPDPSDAVAGEWPACIETLSRSSFREMGRNQTESNSQGGLHNNALAQDQMEIEVGRSES